MSASQTEYLTAYRALDRLFKETGVDEFAILLGAMDIDRGDNRPMDPRMWEYWEEASKDASGVDVLLNFLSIYAGHLTPPPLEFDALLGQLKNRSSSAYKLLVGYWQDARSTAP
ncbi:MAG: hypothetical protein WA198_12520 [Candidatus Sulfotelmatobacter sp.]